MCRSPNMGKVQVGKTPDSCTAGSPCAPALLEKGREIKGNVLCLPALLSLSVSTSCSLEANSAGFPRSRGATVLPHAPDASLPVHVSPKPTLCPPAVFFSRRDIIGETAFPLQKESLSSVKCCRVTHASRRIPVPNAVRKRITFD